MDMAGRGNRKEVLWKEFFRDPSQWWDNRSSKPSHAFPDFKHKVSRECLWVDGALNPQWVLDELRKQDEELCFVNQHDENQQDSETDLVVSIRVCTKSKDLFTGNGIHAGLLKSGLLGTSSYVLEALVIMYAKSGALAKAKELHDMLQIRSMFSWTALIGAFAQQGQAQDALTSFEDMRRDGLSPDAVTFAFILKACGIMKALEKGEIIHDEIAQQGFLKSNIKLGTALVDMYVKCGALSKAEKVLLEVLPNRDAVSWSVLIAGYAQQGDGEKALTCYKKMQEEGFSSDAVTFTSVLKACGSIGAVEMGKHIHDEIVGQRLLGTDIVLSNALVDMYVKCGALGKAHQVLQELPSRDSVSWSTLIAGYAQHGQGEQALDCFRWMQKEGLFPNEVTFTCVLKACGSIGATEKGEQIHDEIGRRGLLGKSVVLGNALVDMYAKCGALAKAAKVLKGLPVRDVVSWSALIAGYVEQGQGEDALDCYECMRSDGLSADAMTFALILKACGSIGVVDKGEEIHHEIAKQRLLERDMVLGNLLVDMYVKCGALAKAQEVLEELPSSDVVSWSTLIGGYAQQGQSQDVMSCFRKMQCKGVSPNAATLSCVLNACSHAGLVEEGQMCFANMSTIYGIEPDLEHYICAIDLFGRAGHIDKAASVIENLPSFDCSVVWTAMLGACRKWRDVKVGRWAFEHAIQVDRTDEATYYLMANIYIDAGMEEEAQRIETMRVENRARKKSGRSWWVDASGYVHTFVAGGTKHAQSKTIDAKLKDLAHKLYRQEGYLSSLHGDNSNNVREDLLCGHSQKLALACALINTSQEETVRVVMNTRMCGDCHATTSLISKIEKRRIVVRDANCCHDFENAKCSCGEFW